MTESDEEEYCAKCGYSEFNEDGTRSHDDEEEYDHDFEYKKEDDEEDEGTTLEDVDKIIDTASKGLDFLNKVKKYSEPPQPKPLSDDEAKFIGQDMERKRRKKQQEKDEQKEKDKEPNKKWKIETIIKIAVPIIVALIGVGFFLI